MTLSVPTALEAARSAEYADLAGESGDEQYRAAMGAIAAAIGLLRQEYRAIESLRRHAHQWDSDSRCSLCGADGLV